MTREEAIDRLKDCMGWIDKRNDELSFGHNQGERYIPLERIKEWRVEK